MPLPAPRCGLVSAASKGCHIAKRSRSRPAALDAWTYSTSCVASKVLQSNLSSTHLFRPRTQRAGLPIGCLTGAAPRLCIEARITEWSGGVVQRKRRGRPLLKNWEASRVFTLSFLSRLACTSGVGPVRSTSPGPPDHSNGHSAKITSEVTEYGKPCLRNDSPRAFAYIHNYNWTNVSATNVA